MQKIIRGKRYDTNTAKKMGNYEFGYPGDLSYWSETLYRKNTGEFFLLGEGGASSRYAVAIDANSWKGGKKIIPLTVEQARAWAEEHFDADEFEKIFGVVEATDNKKIVTFSLPEDVVETIKRNSAADGIPMSEYIAKIVNATKM